MEMVKRRDDERMLQLVPSNGPRCMIHQSIALYTNNNTICHSKYASKHRIDGTQVPITQVTESDLLFCSFIHFVPTFGLDTHINNYS